MGDTKKTLYGWYSVTNQSRYEMLLILIKFNNREQRNLHVQSSCCWLFYFLRFCSRRRCGAWARQYCYHSKQFLIRDDFPWKKWQFDGKRATKSTSVGTHTERLIIAIFILLYCFLTSSLPSLQLVPGSEIVGSAEVRKREHENKTGGNWGDQGPFTFTSFLLSVSLVWPGYHRRRRIGNRDLKIRGRRRQRKRRWKSEFVFLQSSSRLLQVTNFVRCRRTLLKLNS